MSKSNNLRKLVKIYATILTILSLRSTQNPKLILNKRRIYEIDKDESSSCSTSSRNKRIRD